MKAKKVRCGKCQRKAIQYEEDGFIIIQCAARSPCGFINKRPIK